MFVAVAAMFSCGGKGEVQPSLLFTDTLREKLDYLVNGLGIKNFVMYVHPFVEAYIKRGLFNSLYRRWRSELGRNFKVMADESLAYLQYRVLDKDRNEINLRDEKDEGTSSTTKLKNKEKNRGAEADDETTAEQQPKAAKPKKRRKSKTKAAAAEATDPAAATTALTVIDKTEE